MGKTRTAGELVNNVFVNQSGSTSFTGSLNVSGSSNVIGSLNATSLTGSLSYTNLTSLPTLVSGSEQVVSILTSLNTYTSSNDTSNSTQNNRLTLIETNTGSSNIRLSNIENRTGSFATTGSNTFFGTQTFTGSVYIANDLIVQGSSSIQYISASSVSIGTNIINLNTATPSIRYAGLSIVDSGSSGVSASLLWDSQTDDFIFTHRSAGSETLDSSMFIYGPLNTGSLDNIVGILPNRLTKGESSNDHTHHITSSQISDDGTTVSIPGNLGVTGSISTNSGFGLKYGSFVSTTGHLNLFSGLVGSTYTLNLRNGTNGNETALNFDGSANRNYTFPNTDGTLALTSNLTSLATTGSNTFIGNQSITGSGSGLYLGGGNNRIYFSNYRALEGGTDGVNLQVGEGYSKTVLQSTSTQVNGNFTPDTNGTRDLGSASLRWGTVYTSDLSLNNGIGDWTIVEGEDDLFLYNNKKGKVYKFALTEVDPNVATPKKS